MVMIASISGHLINYSQPQVAYNVSKAGVLHMLRCQPPNGFAMKLCQYCLPMVFGHDLE